MKDAYIPLAIVFCAVFIFICGHFVGETFVLHGFYQCQEDNLTLEGCLRVYK